MVNYFIYYIFESSLLMPDDLWIRGSPCPLFCAQATWVFLRQPCSPLSLSFPLPFFPSPHGSVLSVCAHAQASAHIRHEKRSEAKRSERERVRARARVRGRKGGRHDEGVDISSAAAVVEDDLPRQGEGAANGSERGCCRPTARGDQEGGRRRSEEGSAGRGARGRGCRGRRGGGGRGGGAGGGRRGVECVREAELGRPRRRLEVAGRGDVGEGLWSLRVLRRAVRWTRAHIAAHKRIREECRRCRAAAAGGGGPHPCIR